MLESRESRIGLERRQRRRLPKPRETRIVLKGRRLSRLLEFKNSRVGLEGTLRTLLVGMHERRTWPSGTKGWHMFNKMSMKMIVQELTEWGRELVIRLELDGVLVPHMIEHFLQTRLTVLAIASMAINKTTSSPKATR